MWRSRHHVSKYRNPFRIQPKRLSRSFFVIPVLFLICSAFYFLFFWKFWNIQTININGNYPIEPESVRNLISNFVSQSLLLPNRHFFIFSAKVLAKTLEEKYPIDLAQVNKNFKNRSVNINIIGKPFIGYWISRGLIFEIDKNGQVIDMAKDTEPDSALKIYNLDNVIPALNDGVISKEALNFIAGLYSQEANQHYKPKFWEFSKNTDQLNLVTEKDFKIHFDYKQKIEDQLKTLDRILTRVISPDDMKKIDYIDLRFGERVYYKLR